MDGFWGGRTEPCCVHVGVFNPYAPSDVSSISEAYKWHENVGEGPMGRRSRRLNMLPSHPLYWLQQMVWHRRLPSFTNALLPHWPQSEIKSIARLWIGYADVYLFQY